MSGFKLVVTSCLILILGTVLVSSVPLTDVDCKAMLIQLRELYDYIVANGDLRAFHELVRKDGRVPSLRLRFGKRSIPEWESASAFKENYVD